MDFAAGFAAGFAYAKKLFGGEGGGSDIYITDYSDTSLAVTVISDRTEETPKTAVYLFTFTLKEYKTVTIAKSSTKQSKRTWTKNIISAVANADGVDIWTLAADSKGSIVAVYDTNGNEILNGSTSGDSVISNTPEGVALGYALAYNKEQENYTEDLIRAYKDGISDEEEIDDGGETKVEVTDLLGGDVCIKFFSNDGTAITEIYGSGGIIEVRDQYIGYRVSKWTVINVYNASTGKLTSSNTSGGINEYMSFYPHEPKPTLCGDWRYEDGTEANPDGITDI